MGRPGTPDSGRHQSEGAEDDPEVDRLVRLARLVAGYREAARRALRFARRYRREEGPRGARERACVEQALAWRKAARDLRASRPGLARTRAGADTSSGAASDPSSRTRTG